jgi:hypothetical protein
MVPFELICIVCYSCYSDYFYTGWTITNSPGTLLIRVSNFDKRIDVQPSIGSASSLYYRLIALNDSAYFYHS